MDFIYLAKHGLNKHGLKTKNWSHLVGDQTVERERERREEEEEKRKRKEGIKQAKIKRYGTLDLYGTNLGIDHMEFVWHSRKD